eukprot:scaffold7832_cov103-Cylindrotheca_fusiformis.AAC.1
MPFNRIEAVCSRSQTHETKVGVRTDYANSRPAVAATRLHCRRTALVTKGSSKEQAYERRRQFVGAQSTWVGDVGVTAKDAGESQEDDLGCSRYVSGEGEKWCEC